MTWAHTHNHTWVLHDFFQVESQKGIKVQECVATQIPCRVSSCHSWALVCELFNVLRSVLNEAGGHGGVKKGGERGSVRNVTPRAKRDDEGHLQESLNFPLRGI